MSSFDYIKTAIRQKGCTLQQVADASGMTKGYLSQLLNAKIKSPSAQKLEALHRFLGLEFPRMQKNIGVVFGKFYPLHTGHIYLIQRACSQVDELHIIMGYDEPRDRQLFEDSAMSQQPTVPRPPALAAADLQVPEKHSYSCLQRRGHGAVSARLGRVEQRHQSVYGREGHCA